MKIAIIGAGAAGVFCASNLSDNFDVKLFEAQSAPLKKLLLTGGGRCNFTNINIDKSEPKNFYPRGAGSLRKPLRRFPAQAAIDFFQTHSVDVKIEDEGRAFPKSDKAKDIANALLKNVSQKIKVNSPVAEIRKSEDKFFVKISNADEEIFDIIILAVGGKCSDSLKSSLQQLGHHFYPEIPSLYGLCASQAQNWEGGITLKDVVLQADFGNKKIKTNGALLTTHFGITGPAVLKFSAFAAEELYANNFQCIASANFLPSENLETISSAFKKARQKESKKLVKNFCPFPLPVSFWQFLLKSAGIAEDIIYANLSKELEAKIVNSAVSFRLDIIGKSTSKGEFVSCGGVDCKDVDFSTMQSKKAENIFFLGECLNIDAITGGFNLHAAWTTAFVCAEYINKTFDEQK